jgi:hypothetical protein
MSVLSFGGTPEELRFSLLTYSICVHFMTRVILFLGRVLTYAQVYSFFFFAYSHHSVARPSAALYVNFA